MTDSPHSQSVVPVSDLTQADVPASPTDVPSSSRALKVLIADDSPLAARMLSIVLQRAGHHVVTASDGIAAAQAVYAELPDVILLDIFMPRMNGYQVCRLIKQDPAVAHIPVIINTASEGRTAEFWSRHTGADGFLLKGTPDSELLSTITRVTTSQAGAGPDAAATHLRPSSPDIAAHPSAPDLGSEEILSKVCALVDQELYAQTVKGMELQTILENLTEGILLVDTQGHITGANRFFCNLRGVQESVLKGAECSLALGEPAGTVTSEVLQQALRDGRPVVFETELASRATKTATPVEISAAPVHDYLGEVVGGVCVFVDITRRKQVETLNRLKNDLTDMIVHDLRTPLTSLLTGLQTVAMLGDMNEDQTEFLDISVEGGQVLLGMINDLLDISKMEDGSLILERKPVTVKDTLERAMRQTAALSQAKGLTVIANVDHDMPCLHADEDKLLRTTVNLLSNAIKFTPDGGSITVTAFFVPRPGRRDSIVVSCADTGEGIPEEAFGRIFEKFGQVETRKSGRKMSSGLGLTFCKMTVEAHGGRIWVESTLGAGTAFFFAIPTPIHEAS